MKTGTIFVIGLAAIAASLVIARVLGREFGAIERTMTDARFRVRGETRLDSSVVILYLSNDDIASLGGPPLRRSYYALLVRILHQLDCRAIGIDVAFTQPDREHREYDEVLARVVGEKPDVVLGGYFRSIEEGPRRSPSTAGDTLPASFVLQPRPGFDSSTVRRGARLDLPIRPLFRAAAGFGHTNVAAGSDIPVAIVNEAGQLVPAFAGAVCRTAGIPESSLVGLTGAAGPNGDIVLNFAGGTHSLNLIRVVEFLQSYDRWHRAGGVMPAVLNVAGKIVLIGVIAEGRSPFFPSPFEPRFPALGLHATFIHDALHGTFIHRTGLWTDALVAVVLGFAAIALMSLRSDTIGLAGTGAVVALYAVLSQILFARGFVLLPAVQPLFTLAVVLVTLLVARHRHSRIQLRSLQRESAEIRKSLHEKETRLKELEGQLSSPKPDWQWADRSALAAEVRRFEAEISRLRSQAGDLQPYAAEGNEDPDPGAVRNFDGLIFGSDSPMAGVISFVEKIAPTDAAVLVFGESGTGKELIARALHAHSLRKANPFLAVNCGALTETLLESELFGHERGAFTGAARQRRGRFELAHQGTIFLDEIAETSEAFQVKLLRVLQDGTFERVGGADTIRADVRVIAATNRDLRQEILEGRFREDLYYRLNVLSINLPPLRERRSDIPLIVRHFVGQESAGLGISSVVMDTLTRSDWKGNIRELQSVVRRAVILASADGQSLIRLRHLPPEMASQSGATTDLEDRILELLRERQFSRNAISDTAGELGGWNRGTVAEYFRGYCFRSFVGAGWDFDAAVARIACSDDARVIERVGKKLREYLANAVECVQPGEPIEASKERSLSKFKNLPQRYHEALDQIIGSYHAKKWTLGGNSAGMQPGSG